MPGKDRGRRENRKGSNGRETMMQLLVYRQHITLHT